MGKNQTKKTNVVRKDGYTVAGVTRDGVSILRSSGRATHFTDKQLDAAIKKVMSDGVYSDHFGVIPKKLSKS